MLQGCGSWNTVPNATRMWLLEHCSKCYKDVALGTQFQMLQGCGSWNTIPNATKMWLLEHSSKCYKAFCSNVEHSFKAKINHESSFQQIKDLNKIIIILCPTVTLLRLNNR